MRQIDEAPEIEFERDLQRAMQPVDPPHGFADKVMAKAGLVAPQVSPNSLRLIKNHRRRGAGMLRSWYALAALLLVGVLSLAGYRRIAQERLKHERQMRAEQQFDLALEMTDRALDQTRQQLMQAGISLER